MSERKISEKSLENLRKSNQESNFLTREAIETALLQLLEKKDLAKISISELVKRAGVSRAAFYRNYDSKEEILESVFKRSVQNIMEQLSHYDVKTDLYLVWVHLFRAAKYSSQASLFSVISLLLVLYFLKNGKRKSAIFSAGTFMPSLIHLSRTDTMAELQNECR